MYTEEMLQDRQVLQELGFNAREIAVLAESPLPELPWLYYQPYVDQFADEYKPYDAKLDHLDAMTLSQLLQKEGASPARSRAFGGSDSALQAVWHAAILKKRGVPLFPPKVYRLKGGNQMLPDTFAAKLGDRVRMKSPVTRIEHSRDSVRVHCRTDGGPVQVDGDYLVCAMSAVMLSQIEVTPAFSPAKEYALNNVPYYFDSRVDPAGAEPVLEARRAQPEHGVRRPGALSTPGARATMWRRRAGWWWARHRGPARSTRRCRRTASHYPGQVRRHRAHRPGGVGRQPVGVCVRAHRVRALGSCASSGRR